MSTSTNAILFYGLCWDEEGTPPWVGPYEDYDEAEYDAACEEEWEDRYGRACGVAEPEEEYPSRHVRPNDDPKYTPEEQAVIDKYHAYWDKKRAAVKASGCSVGFHCSDACLMHYITVDASETTAYRGDPKQIQSLEVGADWDAKLDDFCEKMGIDASKAIGRGWFLVSLWM